MRSLNTLLVRLLITVALSLPVANAQAVEKFREAGIIASLTHNRITIRGVEYRIAPAARLKSNDASRKTLYDFKAGDRIYLEGTLMNGVYYVEFVVYQTPEPS